MKDPIFDSVIIKHKFSGLKVKISWSIKWPIKWFWQNAEIITQGVTIGKKNVSTIEMVVQKDLKLRLLLINLLML